MDGLSIGYLLLTKCLCFGFRTNKREYLVRTLSSSYAGCISSDNCNHLLAAFIQVCRHSVFEWSNLNIEVKRTGDNCRYESPLQVRAKVHSVNGLKSQNPGFSCPPPFPIDLVKGLLSLFSPCRTYQPTGPQVVLDERQLLSGQRHIL